jgi:hypothetical protein
VSLSAHRALVALVALGEHVWLANHDERFTSGLDVLVDGLERARRAPRRRALGDTNHDHPTTWSYPAGGGPMTLDEATR